MKKKTKNYRANALYIWLDCQGTLPQSINEVIHHTNFTKIIHKLKKNSTHKNFSDGEASKMKT